jgi:hypothetical protein
MLEVAVGLGVDRHGLDAEFAASPEYAQGDLAPIGNQDFTDHSSTWMMFCWMRGMAVIR